MTNCRDWIVVDQRWRGDDVISIDRFSASASIDKTDHPSNFHQLSIRIQAKHIADWK